VTVLV